ncbi:MAG: hypothetical protein JSS32_10030 [Verrucomicrobia bacterium]|nr:hypothetical protein [Verrucomicrobiota bacterium]
MSKVQNQSLNFLQLMFILSMNAGLPTLVIGNSFRQISGNGSAICSIVVGNLILWIVGIAIISMSYENRINAIENASIYVGKYGGVIIAVILAFSLMSWFVFLISGTVKTLDHNLHLENFFSQNIIVRFGAGLGVLCALLSIGKINIIKWLSLFGFPIVFGCHLYAFFRGDYSSVDLNISLAGVVTTILVYLPGIMTIPTVFRHSRSKADSFLGFSLTMIVIIIFQISGVFMPNSLFTEHGMAFSIFLTLFLIVYPLICNNLLNIYLASACWDTFMTQSGGVKGSVLFGLFGAAFYTFIQISPPINFVNDLMNSCLSNFGIVLLISFLVETVIKHRPRRLARLMNLIAWLIGCLAAAIWKIKNPWDGIEELFVGAGAIALFYLCLIFVEEMAWSIRMLAPKDHSEQ